MRNNPLKVRAMKRKYEIWQANSDTKTGRKIKFSSFEEIEQEGLKPSKSVYIKVYESEIESDDENEMNVMEGLFIKFQGSKPEGYTGHSLSVSDVIVLDGKAYYVDSISFQPIEFEGAMETKSGLKFELKDKEYIDVLREKAPFFAMDAHIHILNCGKIIVYPEFNEHFGCYEPIDNEYDLGEIYEYLKSL